MRLAVLGLGFMGATHIQALESIPGAELAAVFSRDPRKLSGDLSGVEGNLGTSAWNFDFSRVAKHSNLEAVFSDPSLEAVDICLPTHLHAPAAIAALRAGKHVLVEKPMALDAASARAMIAEAQASGRVLMTAHVLRFFPMYQALDGLGRVRSAQFRRRCAAPAWGSWLADPAQSGGGVFDLLIHDADQCLHLFGPPEAISATGFVDLARGIDVIDATLYYRGFAAGIEGGWHPPRSYPFSMEYTVVTDENTFEYSSRDRPAQPLNGYAAEIEYFLRCCREGQRPLLCPPEESAAAVALMQALLEAREKNGERIPCKSA